jgi:hypothetical protein
MREAWKVGRASAMALREEPGLRGKDSGMAVPGNN